MKQKLEINPALSKVNIKNLSTSAGTCPPSRELAIQV